MTKRFIVIGAIVAVAVQTYFAAGFIWQRAQLLKTGQEVLLDTGFIDPRDLFRGHYVRLRLSIEQVPDSVAMPKFEAGEMKKIFAKLKKGEDGFWVVESVHKTPQAAGGGPIIAGEFRYNRRIDFPIDRYFAPKEEALNLEALRRDRKLGIAVALSQTGQAAIKGIVVDGEAIYDEPLF